MALQTQLESDQISGSMRWMSSYLKSEKYYQLNRQLSEKLFDGKLNVRVYENTAIAVFDMASSLQQFLAHKTHFAAVKNGSSLIDSLGLVWTRTVNPLQLKLDSQNWVEFIESLHAETNFVIWSSENEITGEILVDYNLAQEIHQRLSHKRIYSIQILHDASEFNRPEEKFFPYAIRILRPSLFESDEVAMAVFTDRMKANSQIGAIQNLMSFDEAYQKIENQFFQSPPSEEGESKAESRKLIQNFESQVSQEKNVYYNRFAQATLRRADRVVLNYSQVNAWALMQDLNLKTELAFAPASLPIWILSQWKNWWKEAESEVLLRGLLVISILALRQNPNLALQLNRCVDELKRLAQ